MRGPDVWPANNDTYISVFKGDARGSIEYQAYPDEVLVVITRGAGQTHAQRAGYELNAHSYQAIYNYFAMHPVKTNAAVICPGQGTTHVSYEHPDAPTSYASSCPNVALFDLHETLSEMMITGRRYQ